nr:hypothetical protein CFP56_69091 [Quercus suber]
MINRSPGLLSIAAPSKAAFSKRITYECCGDSEQHIRQGSRDHIGDLVLPVTHNIQGDLKNDHHQDTQFYIRVSFLRCIPLVHEGSQCKARPGKLTTSAGLPDSLE